MKNQKIRRRPPIAIVHAPSMNEKVSKLGCVKKTKHFTKRMIVIIVSLVCMEEKNVD